MISFLRNLIFHDFWLKFFSLALAILIWKIIEPAAYGNKQGTAAAPLISASSERDLTFTIPLAVVSSADDVHDFKVSPSEVEVTVRGPRELINNLQASDIRAQVDLTGIESARNLRKRIEVIPPQGVSTVNYSPSEVEVIFPPKPQSGQRSQL